MPLTTTGLSVGGRTARTVHPALSRPHARQREPAARPSGRRAARL